VPGIKNERLRLAVDLLPADLLVAYSAIEKKRGDRFRRAWPNQ